MDDQLVLVRLKVLVVEDQEAENGYCVPKDGAPKVDHLSDECPLKQQDIGAIDDHSIDVANRKDYTVIPQRFSPLRYRNPHTVKLMQASQKCNDTRRKQQHQNAKEYCRYFVLQLQKVFIPLELDKEVDEASQRR